MKVMEADIQAQVGHAAAIAHPHLVPTCQLFLLSSVRPPSIPLFLRNLCIEENAPTIPLLSIRRLIITRYPLMARPSNRTRTRAMQRRSIKTHSPLIQTRSLRSLKLLSPLQITGHWACARRRTRSRRLISRDTSIPPTLALFAGPRAPGGEVRAGACASVAEVWCLRFPFSELARTQKSFLGSRRTLICRLRDLALLFLLKAELLGCGSLFFLPLFLCFAHGFHVGPELVVGC